MKIPGTILAVLTAAAMVYATGLAVQAYQRQVALLQGRVQRAENHIPTITELQQMLIDKGHYNLKIDGRLGPETMAAWEREINNQYAAKWFEKRDKK
jgi:peptidoglycan hydrolase-like protein with peptidoglycan-binding domain